MPDLLIGCPVAKRDWILDRWFDHVEEAAKRAALPYRFIFAGDPRTDLATFEIVNDRAPEALIVETEEQRLNDVRHWPTHRKQFMVEVRNLLLQNVRKEQPTYFLSLDSDILLHPDSITQYVETIQDDRWDAVGGKCYMTPLPQGNAILNPRVGTSSPSYFRFTRTGNFQRTDVEVPSVFTVDCIMAIKLMGEAAYNVDYAFHNWGEDVGWAKNCQAEGLWFAWDARVTNRHVMRREELDRTDPRCGF